MEKHLLMDISNGGLLYQVFYVLAFLVIYIILIYEGYRRKFPLITWVLLLASIRIAEIVGSKIFSFTWSDWEFMIQNHVFIQNPEKTMFGGALLAVIVYFIARYFLKFREYVWDTVAFVLPVGTMISSVGCFFYGCCFGTRSDLPWAVQYPVMSLAHYHQFESGLLTYNDLWSLPVHPVQLYESFGAGLVIILVFIFRRKWKANGSLLLSSLMLFAMMRFVLEFFRDPLSNKTGGEMLWVFKQVQWQYLVFTVIMTLLLIRRERSFKSKTEIRKSPLPELKTQIAYLLSLALIFLMLRRWFTIPEIIALNIALLPAVLLFSIEVYKKFTSLRFRWVYALSAILPLLLMSQTLPKNQSDTTVIKKYNTYHTVGAGFSTGNYTDEKTSYTGSGCDMVTNTKYFNQEYKAFGGGYSYTKITPDRKEMIRYGANLYLADYEQLAETSGNNASVFIFGVNPYISYDTWWIGIGGGLHIGNLAYTNGDQWKETSTEFEKAYFRTPVFPQVYFRVGPVRYFFADFHLADQFPVSAPGLAFQAGVGSGFGINNGTKLRVGFSFLEESAFYLSAYVPIADRIVLEPLYLWTSKNSVSYPEDHPENQFSLGISYRFGNK
jgi:prolipoprotein diacylglyceryltransferase